MFRNVTENDATLEQQTWSARFGWIAGGIAGVAAGFVGTWLTETRLLPQHGRAAVAVASRISGVLVPACFVVGALAGHAFGLRGGPRRYRMLGAAAGLALAVLGWGLIVATR